MSLFIQEVLLFSYMIGSDQSQTFFKERFFQGFGKDRLLYWSSGILMMSRGLFHKDRCDSIVFLVLINHFSKELQRKIGFLALVLSNFILDWRLKIFQQLYEYLSFTLDMISKQKNYFFKQSLLKLIDMSYK